MEIPQAAFAFLEIGLNDIPAVAHALVADITLSKLFGDEGARRPRDDLGRKARRRFLIKPLIPPDIAAFQKRGADREILFRHPDHFIERAARMSDLQP